jgi:hypothetical protein
MGRISPGRDEDAAAVAVGLVWLSSVSSDFTRGAAVALLPYALYTVTSWPGLMLSDSFPSKI